MTDTETLIARLSSEASTSGKPLTPGYWGSRLVAVLGLYAIGTQLVLGLRPDLALQFSRSAFSIEFAMLLALVLSCVVASVLAMYPDAFQRPRLLAVPYALCIGLSLLLGWQLFLAPDVRMVVPGPGAHGLECALCIGSIAVVPAALIFGMLRRGASVRQFQAGFFAVLAASAIGCLTLRLSESNDSLLHVASWHYLPTFFFAALGAGIGKRLLRW